MQQLMDKKDDMTSQDEVCTSLGKQVDIFVDFGPAFDTSPQRFMH